jgi:hypothetical protein
LDEALAAAEDTDEEDDDNILPEPSFVFGDLQTDQVETGQETDHSSNSSGSLFSSRSWQDKVVRGELTAMVRDKSRSVQDLMVLTAVEPMSDIEFLSFNQPSKPDQQENGSHAMAPQISVTSPSFTVRSPMMESDVPLLENDSKYNIDSASYKFHRLILNRFTNSNGKDSLDTGTYMTRNRNRLTSTPREDTDFEAMESRYVLIVELMLWLNRYIANICTVSEIEASHPNTHLSHRKVWTQLISLQRTKNRLSDHQQP